MEPFVLSNVRLCIGIGALMLSRQVGCIFLAPTLLTTFCTMNVLVCSRTRPLCEKHTVTWVSLSGSSPVHTQEFL